MAQRKPSENGAFVPESSSNGDGSARGERSNLPVHVVRFGLVRASIWPAPTDQGMRHNVTVSRLYKGTDGIWYSTSVFSYRDLLPLAKALDWSHSWISQEIAGSAEPPF